VRDVTSYTIVKARSDSLHILPQTLELKPCATVFVPFSLTRLAISSSPILQNAADVIFLSSNNS
jgi:hypothetical protein